MLKLVEPRLTSTPRTSGWSRAWRSRARTDCSVSVSSPKNENPTGFSLSGLSRSMNATFASCSCCFFWSASFAIISRAEGNLFASAALACVCGGDVGRVAGRRLGRVAGTTTGFVVGRAGLSSFLSPSVGTVGPGTGGSTGFGTGFSVGCGSSFPTGSGVGFSDGTTAGSSANVRLTLNSKTARMRATVMLLLGLRTMWGTRATGQSYVAPSRHSIIIPYRPPRCGQFDRFDDSRHNEVPRRLQRGRPHVGIKGGAHATEEKQMTLRQTLTALIVTALSACSAAHAQSTVTVSAGKIDRNESLASFALPQNAAQRNWRLRDEAGDPVPIQVNAGKAYFILKDLKAGKTRKYTLEEVKLTTETGGVVAKRE